MSLTRSDFPRSVTIVSDFGCGCGAFSRDYHEWLHLEEILFGASVHGASPELEDRTTNERRLTMFGEQRLIELRQKYRVYRFPKYVFDMIFIRLNHRYLDEVVKNA
jgi:hypothetical protein